MTKKKIETHQDDIYIYRAICGVANNYNKGMICLRRLCQLVGRKQQLADLAVTIGKWQGRQYRI